MYHTFTLLVTIVDTVAELDDYDADDDDYCDDDGDNSDWDNNGDDDDDAFHEPLVPGC